MFGIIRALLPERMSGPAARAFAAGPARCFLPLYRMIAAEVAAQASGVLLDIGTGPGILPLEIARRSPQVRVIGTDASRDMIHIAHGNKERSGDPAVDFLAADANDLPLKDNSVDMIISTDALHHWKRPVRVLDEMYRCLKPGKEAWVYDGFAGASDEAIAACIARSAGSFPFLSYPWLTRCVLGVHGFSRREYATTVPAMVEKSRFGTCVSEERGIMMRLRLVKKTVDT